jgi:cyclophilin family peptidyl-prolyl cis-trans isomerase
MRIPTLILAAMTGVLLMTGAAQAQTKLNPENTVYLDLKYGRVVIALRPDLAPITVAHFKELIRRNPPFYDGLKFHRVIAGFMAQTGDPKGNGTGGSGQTVPAEFTRKASFERGALGLARAQDPNSGDSQFFICLDDASFLDGQYTLFGQVVSGMEFVDQIKTGPKQLNGQVPGEPDIIVKMRVMADAEKAGGAKP